MRHRWNLGILSLIAPVLLWSGCPEEPTTPPATRGSILIKAVDANGDEADAIPADGQAYLTLQITAKAPGGAVAANTEIELLTNLGSFATAQRSDTLTVTTDGEGQASAQWVCAKPGSGDPEDPGGAALTARNTNAVAKINLFCEALANLSTLSFGIEGGATNLYADGTSDLVLLAVATDSTGAAQRNARIEFEVVDGSQRLVSSTGLVSQTAGMTNNSGEARVTVRAPATPQSFDVQATWDYDTGNNPAFVETVTLSFGEDQSEISLTADRVSAPADGSVSFHLTATALDRDGQPLADGMDVTFRANEPYGFGSPVSQQTTSQTAGGAGEATATLNASLTQGIAQLTAEFEAAPGQTRRSLPLQVEFVEPGRLILLVTATPTAIYTDDLEVTTIDIQAERDGQAVGSQNLTISLSAQDAAMATFGVQGASTSLAQVSRTTDSQGAATTELRGFYSGAAGTVTVTVSTVDTQNANITVTGVATVLLKRHPLLQSVVFMGAVPAMLGTRGSPRPSTAVVTFQALDDNNVPMEGINFRFLRPITIDPTVVITTVGGGDTVASDASGTVIAYLSAGVQAHPVRVIAEATDPRTGLTIVVTSDSIPITTGLTSWTHSWFVCEPNGATLAPPASRTCEAVLADRFSERVPGGTTVQFRVESGNITPTATVTGDGSAGGVSYLTGTPPPSDTRDKDGNLGTSNPIDRLVNMLAYTRGEEPFTDVNGNGIYDPGEPFLDFPEPFVDKQDNCERNDATDPTDEYYVDPTLYPGNVADPYVVLRNTDPFIDGNNDGHWNGPNAQWDDDTLLWFQEQTLWVYGAVAFDLVDADCVDSLVPGQVGYPDYDNAAHLAYLRRCAPQQDVRWDTGSGQWVSWPHATPWLEQGESVRVRFRAYDSFENCPAPGVNATYTWSAENAEGNGTTPLGFEACGLYSGQPAVNPVTGHLQPYCTVWDNIEVDARLRVQTYGVGSVPYTAFFDTIRSGRGQPIILTVGFGGVDNAGGVVDIQRTRGYIVPCSDDLECGATFIETDAGMVRDPNSATCNLRTGYCEGGGATP
ncbi:MAG: invasin domain 3-containing protein [Pseudomonadota bacterium]